MEIDSDTKTPQVLRHLSPPVAKLPKPRLSQGELVALNTSMNEWSSGISSRTWKVWFPTILVVFTGMLSGKADIIASPSIPDAAKLLENLDDEESNEWENGVKAGIENGDWAKLSLHPMLWKPAETSTQAQLRGDKMHFEKVLTTAYNTPFVGDTAKELVEYFKTTEAEIKANEKVPYAKAVTIVQSSGTGKSRLLTEAGKHIFTLPICLRGEGDPGYPPPDLEVVKYLGSLSTKPDLSYDMHVAVACFLAAAHTTMLEWLKKAQETNEVDLHTYWHQSMEPVGKRDSRNSFFSEVVKLANSLKERHRNLLPGPSPKRSRNGADEEVLRDMSSFAETTYKTITKQTTEDLMKFLSNIWPDALCVMYFDEAHKLKVSLSVLLRLLRNQDLWTRMWYIFMGTKSNLSYYSPRPSESQPLFVYLLPPYVGLGFDQHAIAKGRARTAVYMRDLQSIGHLAQYGRPLWSAQLPGLNARQMIELASLKLTDGASFSPSDKDHVFAVLSQRLCLDLVLSGSEALRLADRSVANHMRLLTGFSENNALFNTHSSSEPLLALGSINILYNKGRENQLGDSLRTLTRDLCSAGLVEKGLMGELGGRTLLLAARDFTAPVQDGNRNLLVPVPLLSFLDTLLCDQWANSNRTKFMAAFGDAQINFTHWIVTKDPLPVEPDEFSLYARVDLDSHRQLLANLWARGAALQCSFTQATIDLLIPTYRGSVNPDAVFDPYYLSGVPLQIKLKDSGDPNAADRIRPPAIPRDSHAPLPYLAILMELGCESLYHKSQSKVVSTPFETTDGEFAELTTALAAAKRNHMLGREQVTGEAELKKLKKSVREAQLAVDSYNRYMISVCGASQEVYQILRRANIAHDFEMLLKITTSSPSNQQATLQHMRPLERLGGGFHHTDWMSEYIANDGKMVLD